MRQYTSNQEFYKHIDEVVAELRSVGHEVMAEKINFLLHDAAWTTTSELFGELREHFQELLDYHPSLPQKIRGDITGFITTINRAWDRANGITQ